MKSSAICLVTVLLLTGCATAMVPVATGGSRSDGTIVMSYEYGAFQSPQIDWQRVQTDAGGRCAAWGYESAEAFGGTTRHCISPDGFGGCNRYRVDMQYQCMGDL